MAGPGELDQAAVVDDAVDHRRGHLVVPQHGAPLAELDVGGDDQAAPLVAVGHHLEQQPRAVEVQRHVAELVQDDQVVPRDVAHRRLERVLAGSPAQRKHQFGGGVEAHRLPPRDRGGVDGYRQVRLAPAGRP